jgi:multidrug efflux pump subunit AcrA (membrane-fusion protein)
VTVPATAVNQGPNGPFVFVVDGSNDTARMQPVKVTTTQDFTAVIQDGVKPGDTVVTDGQLSLRPGSKVHMRSADGAGGAGGSGGGRPGGGGKGQNQGKPPAS